MKSRLFVFVCAWDAFLDLLLGERCHCGDRVYPKDLTVHYMAHKEHL